AVLLSVGYAACHWCHVMAHESFEDDETARLMNELFVNVKVDREERPDVDALYMDAVVSLTGQGGWPMTVFITPDGAPFFAGTYDRAPAAHRRARHGHEDARRDGGRGDVRPRRRGLPPLLGRPAVARPALREDAVRQRAARARLPARMGGDRARAVPRGGGG